MTAFTRLGSSIWDWEPWTELAPPARILWLALYTSGEAKRHVPGLWQGGIPSMADAARMKADDVRDALDNLLVQELVEYDSKFRVLRLCELPDTGEWPNNGKVIRGWWTKFQTVPVCAVRDAHVRTLAWICEEGAKRTRRPRGYSNDHQTAWDDTFAHIVVPVPRRRGVRRLADSDTGTQNQPSLFSHAAGSDPSPSAFPDASSLPGRGNEAIPGAGGYPQDRSGSVDNSASLRQTNKINAADTVSDTVSDTNRIPDPGSRIPDLSSLSGSGEVRGTYGTMRPALSLVPAYTAAQVIREMAQGLWDDQHDKTHQDALSAMIPVWVAGRVALDDFALLAQFNAHSSRKWNARLLLGCDIAAELDVARRVLQWRDARAAMLRDTMP